MVVRIFEEEYIFGEHQERDILHKEATHKSVCRGDKDLWPEDLPGRIVNGILIKSHIQGFAPSFMRYEKQDTQDFLCYLPTIY